MDAGGCRLSAAASSTIPQREINYEYLSYDGDVQMFVDLVQHDLFADKTESKVH